MWKDPTEGSDSVEVRFEDEMFPDCEGPSEGGGDGVVESGRVGEEVKVALRGAGWDEGAVCGVGEEVGGEGQVGEGVGGGEGEGAEGVVLRVEPKGEGLGQSVV